MLIKKINLKEIAPTGCENHWDLESRAIIGGVGRTSVTTAVGVGTNFVVTPIATSLAKSAGIDQIWANDIGIGTGFATSIFTAGKAYKAGGNGAEVNEGEFTSPNSNYVFKDSEIVNEIQDISSQASIDKMETFNNSLDTLLKEYNMTQDEFELLSSKSISELNESELKTIYDIRNSYEMPENGTLMSKVIPDDAFENCINNGEYSKTVVGCVAKAQDTAGLKTYNDYFNTFGLGYDESPYKNPAKDSMYVMEIVISKSEFTEDQIKTCLEGCFTGKTLINTEFGLRRIDSIKEGERVYSEDAKTGQKSLKKVLYVYKKHSKDIMIITIGSEKIETTAPHLFYTEEGFKPAEMIKAGDKIKDSIGIYKEVTDISTRHTEEGEAIYNLNVEDYHTYFVGGSSLLVHNDCSVSNEEVKTVTDAIKNGKGNKGAGEAVNSIPRIKEIEVNFNYNTKYDEGEFAKQLADQEVGMNKLTVDEYLKNRERYIAEGRSIEGNMAQQAARKEALANKIDELLDSGMSYQEAETQANKWMESQAALHNPDQIAGGNPLNIGRMGDKGINSSIGSQWKYRIDAVDEQIQQMAKNMTDAERKSTYLNVKLTY